MDKLWAPWRLKYTHSKRQKKCIFCSARKSILRLRSGLTASEIKPSKSKNYTFIKNRYSFAILNKYPYNNGHIIIAPLRHIRNTEQLKDEEIIDIFKILNEVKFILNKVLKPQGYNIGINIADVAGAGVLGHLHIHIVPRYKGDTNFMPVIYNTKVISQSLDDLYKRLKDAYAKRNKRI